MSATIYFNNTDDLVNNFAKATKVSKAKLLDFVEQLKASAIQVKPERANNGGPVGKPASVASLKVRQWLEENGQSLVGKQMTNKEFALLVGVDKVTAGNNVQWAVKQNMIKFVGHAEKTPGVRGPREVLWEVIAKE